MHYFFTESDVELAVECETCRDVMLSDLIFGQLRVTEAEKLVE